MNGNISQNFSFEAMAELMGGEQPKQEKTELSADLFLDEDSEQEVVTETTEENDEEVVAETTEEEVEVSEKPDLEKRSHYADTALSLLDTGVWSDFSIDYEGEHYEDLESFLKKVDIDDELFRTMVEKQNEYKLSDIESKSIRIDDLDETRANIVKAIATGVDAKALLNVNDTLIEPLKMADLSDDKVAMNILANDLKNSGYEDDYIQYKINTWKQQGLLSVEAETVREKYIAEFNSVMEAKQQEVLEIEKQKIEQEKQAKKEFRKTLKDKEYTDTFAKQATELMYGKTDGVENWVLQANTLFQENPDVLAEFAHYLLNREDFLNKKTADLRRDEKIKRLSNFELVKASNKSKDGGFAPKGSGKDDLFSGEVTFKPINK